MELDIGLTTLLSVIPNLRVLDDPGCHTWRGSFRNRGSCPCKSAYPRIPSEQETLWVGDKVYVGRGRITSFKKPQARDLPDWQEAFNIGINFTRTVIERVITDLNYWRIRHDDYRRPFDTFRSAITAIELYFYSLI